MELGETHILAATMVDSILDIEKMLKGWFMVVNRFMLEEINLGQELMFILQVQIKRSNTQIMDQVVICTFLIQTVAFIQEYQLQNTVWTSKINWELAIKRISNQHKNIKKEEILLWTNIMSSKKLTKSNSNRHNRVVEFLISSQKAAMANNMWEWKVDTLTVSSIMKNKATLISSRQCTLISWLSQRERHRSSCSSQLIIQTHLFRHKSIHLW